jgi:hypothetical protein
LKKHEEYLTKLCYNFTPIQEKFRELYQIDAYDYWFYNESSELLRLYSSDKEIYFKYIPIGNYILDAKAWSWSWTDIDSIEQSKMKMIEVKNFCFDMGFGELIADNIIGDEYIGWECTALAHNILGGLGAYRINGENCEKYIILTQVVSSEAAAETESNLIKCNEHGLIRRAFVCQHLTQQSKLGFEEAFDTYPGMILNEDDDFQAWCNDCEKIRIKSDGWNDESMDYAKIKLVCESCYFKIKKVNKQ